MTRLQGGRTPEHTEAAESRRRPPSSSPRSSTAGPSGIRRPLPLANTRRGHEAEEGADEGEDTATQEVRAEVVACLEMDVDAEVLRSERIVQDPGSGECRGASARGDQARPKSTGPRDFPSIRRTEKAHVQFRETTGPS